MFRFLPGDGSLGQALIDHADLVCFTGSVATGRKVALTSVAHEGEKQAFKSSGMGGSRMGPASIRRFLITKALIENTQTAWDPWWF